MGQFQNGIALPSKNLVFSPLINKYPLQHLRTFKKCSKERLLLENKHVFLLYKLRAHGIALYLHSTIHITGHKNYTFKVVLAF